MLHLESYTCLVIPRTIPASYCLSALQAYRVTGFRPIPLPLIGCRPNLSSSCFITFHRPTSFSLSIGPYLRLDICTLGSSANSFEMRLSANFFALGFLTRCVNNILELVMLPMFGSEIRVPVNCITRLRTCVFVSGQSLSVSIPTYCKLDRLVLERNVAPTVTRGCDRTAIDFCVGRFKRLHQGQRCLGPVSFHRLEVDSWR